MYQNICRKRSIIAGYHFGQLWSFEKHINLPKWKTPCFSYKTFRAINKIGTLIWAKFAESKIDFYLLNNFSLNT